MQPSASWMDRQDRRIGGKQYGFSLLELLIVLATIGILAAIAYPIYTHVLTKTRRIEAKTALLHLANQMEIYRIENNHSYANASLSKLGFKEETENHLYRLSLNSSQSRYQLMATANFLDPECHQFMLNELGEKTSNGGPQPCW